MNPKIKPHLGWLKNVLGLAYGKVYDEFKSDAFVGKAEFALPSLDYTNSNIDMVELGVELSNDERFARVTINGSTYETSIEPSYFPSITVQERLEIICRAYVYEISHKRFMHDKKLRQQFKEYVEQVSAQLTPNGGKLLFVYEHSKPIVYYLNEQNVPELAELDLVNDVRIQLGGVAFGLIGTSTKFRSDKYPTCLTKYKEISFV